MASRVVFALTQAQVEALLRDRRKKWERWQHYRVFSTLKSRGLVVERGDRWQLTVAGVALVEYLKLSQLAELHQA